MRGLLRALLACSALLMLAGPVDHISSDPRVAESSPWALRAVAPGDDHAPLALAAHRSEAPESRFQLPELWLAALVALAVVAALAAGRSSGWWQSLQRLWPCGGAAMRAPPLLLV